VNQGQPDHKVPKDPPDPKVLLVPLALMVLEDPQAKLDQLVPTDSPDPQGQRE